MAARERVSCDRRRLRRRGRVTRHAPPRPAPDRVAVAHAPARVVGVAVEVLGRALGRGARVGRLSLTPAAPAGTAAAARSAARAAGGAVAAAAARVAPLRADHLALDQARRAGRSLQPASLPLLSRRLGRAGLGRRALGRGRWRGGRVRGGAQGASHGRRRPRRDPRSPITHPPSPAPPSSQRPRAAGAPPRCPPRRPRGPGTCSCFQRGTQRLTRTCVARAWLYQDSAWLRGGS